MMIPGGIIVRQASAQMVVYDTLFHSARVRQAGLLEVCLQPTGVMPGKTILVLTLQELQNHGITWVGREDI